MKIDLAIVGQGAVSPAGVGLAALSGKTPVPRPVATLRRPDKSWPVLRVDLKDPAFRRWDKAPRLRRASPITLYLVEAAEQALAGLSPAERAETGLIVAYCAGCVAYSCRFLGTIITQGQRAASPALFPETVFNSPVSHVASVLGLNGAAYALVGDETAWIAGLRTASVWLRQGRVKQVLVLGAEEFDPAVLDAYESARWLSENSSGFLTAEGAAGVLVRPAQPGDPLVISRLTDGFIYRTKKEAASAAAALLREVDSTVPVYASAQRNWLAGVEKKALENRPQVPSADEPYLGEAFTASCAWRALRAANHLTTSVPRILYPVWGLNHQLGLLELERRG